MIYKTAFSCLLFLLLSLAGPAQTVFGLDLSRLKGMLEEDRGAYPHLILKLNHPDSTLDDGEAALLYYGSMFQASYEPYRERETIRQVEELLRQRQFRDALVFIDRALIEQPVLRLLLNKSIALEKMGQTAAAQTWRRKYLNLLQIPYMSGSGATPGEARVVRSVEDEYLVIWEMGYEVEEESTVADKADNSYDRFLVSNAQGEKYAFYFDISLPFRQGLEKLSGKSNQKGK